MTDNLFGKNIGEFIIEERLGQGAMAVVYKAFQPSINRYVALKVIRLDEGQGLHEDFRRRFALEAEVIARLEHIHILPIYAYGINEEMAYLAMRWLRGGSLSQLMRSGDMGMDQALDIFNQIAKGLAYAHSKGIIHRDLKPSNIMLDDTGNAYLTDFGLAKLVESSGEITKSGTIVGTPAYMSPEQLRGDPLDYRSDIYSLGVILYNMLAGRLPFDTTAGDVVSVIYQHLETPPTPPREFNPSISPQMEAIILKALHKDRTERYSSVLDMAKAVSTATGRSISSDTLSEIPVARIPSGTHPIIPPTRSSRLYTILGIAGFLMLIVAGALFIQNVSTNNQIAQTATANAWTPTPLPQAIIRKGEREPADQILPDQAQIAMARNQIGSYGFIAYIACNQDSEFHAAMAREIRDLAEQYRLAYRIYDSANDDYNQLTQIERARSDGARALILCPLNPDLLKESLTSVQNAHIPLVIFADNMPSYGGILTGGDNYLLGLEPGRYAGNIIQNEMGGKADAVILDYPDLDYIVERANGLEDGLKEMAPDVHIVGRYKGATREFGKASIAKLIADHVKFNVIVSINDAGSFGAIEAMQDAGMDCNSVVIVSIDAEALAQQYIRDGCFMRGSVQSSRVETAHALLNATVQLLSGGTIAELVQIPPGMMVTKETLDQADATATAENLTPGPSP